MFSKRTDNVWLTVGILLIAGIAYMGAERLYIARLRAERLRIQSQEQTVQYSNALIACRAKLTGK